jgi:quinol monooxygenase YgiN
MVIALANLRIDAGERDDFVLGSHGLMVRTRSERGCLAYALLADPVDPGRVVIVEHWQAQADFAARLPQRLAAVDRALPGPGGLAGDLIRYQVAATGMPRPFSR